MRLHLAWVGVLTCALGAVPTGGSGQSSDSLFASGVRAYNRLEFDLAAWSLRRDLAQLSGTGATVADRVRGLVYLGAAELFRGQRDSAVAAFRRLVMLDPRYSPDRLVFPPEVTTVFDAVRMQTKTAVAALPTETEISPGSTSLRFWVFASSFQLLDVSLRYEDGAPFRALYGGLISDSLELQWDGLDAAGGTPTVRRLLLRIASRERTGALAGIVQLPLDIRLSRPDTLSWPAPLPDSQFLPERARSGPAMRALLGGVFLSGAVAALPTLVGGADTPSGPRIAVAGTIGFAGVLGYLLHRPGRPLGTNVRANEALRAEWQRQVAAVTAENARRLADVRLRVHAGDPAAIEAAGP